MSDWQVGDLAVCVAAKPNYYGSPHPCQLGGVYVVERVVVSITSGSLGLSFTGVVFPDCIQNADGAENYRKIRPDEHEACEEEFVTLLKRSRKRVSA